MIHVVPDTTRRSQALSADAIDAFARDGYTIVSGALPTSEIVQSRARLSEIFATRPEPARGDNQAVRSDIIARYEWLANLLFGDAVLTPLRSLLGDRIVFLPETSITDSQFGGWHTDLTSAELAGETFRTANDFRVVNAAIYFQENGTYGGGLDVVPGSHLAPDEFLAAVKKQYDDHERTKLQQQIKGAIRAMIPDALMKLRPTAAQQTKMRLQGESQQPGQVTIRQRPGDLVVFDLRLSHKATWPEVPPPHPPEARKFSFFAICGADNPTTRRYCEYLKKRAKTQPAYAYLNGHTYPGWLADQARAAGVILL